LQLKRYERKSTANNFLLLFAVLFCVPNFYIILSCLAPIEAYQSQDE
jgi:hypothetical protein